MKRWEKYESVLIIAAGFLTLYLVFENKWFLLISFLILLLSALSDGFVKGLTWFWFKLAAVLGWINSRILLAIIFYFMLVPLAFMARLLNKTTIKFKKNKDTYYVERNHSYVAEDIEHMW